MDNEHSGFIPNEDIICRGEQGDIDTVEALERHIYARAGLFLHKLSLIALRANTPSWEFLRDSHGIPIKHASRVSAKAVVGEQAFFTAKHTCAIATLALQEALELKTSGLRFDIVGLTTDLNAERWNDPTYHGEDRSGQNHILLKVTEQKNGTTYFIDPTYAQIDHTQAGKILCIPRSELDSHYRMYNEGQSHSVQSTMGPPDLIPDLKKKIKEGLFVVSAEDYTTLVNTLL